MQIVIWAKSEFDVKRERVWLSQLSVTAILFSNALSQVAIEVIALCFYTIRTQGLLEFRGYCLDIWHADSVQIELEEYIQANAGLKIEQ